MPSIYDSRAVCYCLHMLALEEGAKLAKIKALYA